MADPKGWFSPELEVKGWFGAEPIEYWFDADLYTVSSASGAVTQASTYTDADTFYSGSASLNVSGALYTDPDTFYTGTVTTRVNGTLYTDDDTFYGGTVSTGIPTQTVTQSVLYTDADTFYAGALSARISQSALYTDSDTLYAGTLAQALSGGLYEDADTFYGGVVQANVTVSQSALFDDGDTFYGGVVTDSNATPTVVISGKQAQDEWESRQKWRKQAETLLIEPEPVDPVPEVVQEVIEDILPRLYEPVESLAELVADARLLQLDEARALESAMAVKDVLAIAELAYLAEVAVQQEKDAIAAFMMFMD